MIRQTSYPPPWYLLSIFTSNWSIIFGPFLVLPVLRKHGLCLGFFPGLGGTFSTLSPQCTDSVEEASTIPEGNSTWKKREGCFFFMKDRKTQGFVENFKKTKSVENLPCKQLSIACCFKGHVLERLPIHETLIWSFRVSFKNWILKSRPWKNKPLCNSSNGLHMLGSCLFETTSFFVWW